MVLDNKKGPLHGMSVLTPYQTKGNLQRKRFQAQSNGTTYVYDLPDMFRQMAERQWKEFSKERPTIRVPASDRILLKCSELVYENETLSEVHRSPGENTVGFFYLPVCVKKIIIIISSVALWPGELLFLLQNIRMGEN